MTQTPLISIRDLTRGYTHQRMLFQRLSMTLTRKHFTILQGNSGSGKTTLVKMLTGYLQPPKKTIFHQHDDIARLTKNERQHYKRRLGTVYQDNKLLPYLTIQENICYPLRLYRTPANIIQRRYQHTKKLVGLTLPDDAYTQQLSGGEQQKVGIARALIHHPECIIADEPTGNLDPIATKLVADTLMHVHQKGTTILLITHDQALVDYIQQHINTDTCQLDTLQHTKQPIVTLTPLI